MPLATYTDLQASVADWLHRTDLTAQIPDFIRLAEVRIARDLKSLNLEKSQAITTVAGSSSYPIPASAVSLIRVVGQYGEELNEYDPSQQWTQSGKPRYYYVQTPNLNLYPTPDAGYPVTLIYRSELTPLSTTVATNEVLTQYPNIYLCASMVEAHIWTMEPDMAGPWEQRYAQAVKTANKANNFKRKTKLSTEVPRTTRWNIYEGR